MKIDEDIFINLNLKDKSTKNKIKLISYAADIFEEAIFSDRRKIYFGDKDMCCFISCKYNGIKILFEINILSGNGYLIFSKNFFKKYKFRITEYDDKDENMTPIYEESSRFIEIYKYLRNMESDKAKMKEIDKQEKIIDILSYKGG